MCYLFGIDIPIGTDDDGRGIAKTLPLGDFLFRRTINRNPEATTSIPGGGFSNYFLCESYQDIAVFSFLQNPDSQSDSCTTLWATAFSTSLRRRTAGTGTLQRHKMLGTSSSFKSTHSLAIRRVRRSIPHLSPGPEGGGMLETIITTLRLRRNPTKRRFDGDVLARQPTLILSSFSQRRHSIAPRGGAPGSASLLFSIWLMFPSPQTRSPPYPGRE
ncbi:hypothetical protein V8E53_010195 [Lactarius tabidus]